MVAQYVKENILRLERVAMPLSSLLIRRKFSNISLIIVFIGNSLCAEIIGDNHKILFYTYHYLSF